MLDVFIQHVLLFHLADSSTAKRLEVSAHHGFFNVLEPRIAADWACFLLYELHAVIFLRIVAGRNHDTAIQLEVCGCEVNHFRTTLTDIHDIAASLGKSLDQCFLDRWSG